MTVFEVLFYLLTRNATSDFETSEFKELKHNADLVPTITQNLNIALSCIKHELHNAYDIQGIKDNGVDILVKTCENDKNLNIGFQIKSYDDILEDGWQMKLKAQMFEAISTWNISHLFVLFCSDIKIHLDKIRNATASLMMNGKITIITPNQALAFYKMNVIQILSKIGRIISNNKSLIEILEKQFSPFNNFELAIIVYAAVETIIEGKNYIKNEDLFTNSFVYTIKEQFFPSNYEIETNAYMSLEDTIFFESYANEGLKYRIHDGSKELMALIADVQTKINNNPYNVMEYIFEMFRK
jgi:hypothetical protein